MVNAQRRCGRTFGCSAAVGYAAAPDGVAFECDGTSSECANGTLTWSCSEHCTSSGGCAMDLSAAGLRGTLPAALGDVRCAPWVTRLCVRCGRAPNAPSRWAPDWGCFGSRLNQNPELSGDVPESAGNFRSLKEL